MEKLVIEIHKIFYNLRKTIHKQQHGRQHRMNKKVKLLSYTRPLLRMQKKNNNENYNKKKTHFQQNCKRTEIKEKIAIFIYFSFTNCGGILFRIEGVDKLLTKGKPYSSHTMNSTKRNLLFSQ